MNCLDQSKELLQQILALLEKMDASSYGEALPLLSGATIGQHFRHIINFYECILTGLEEGNINYSNRDRNTKVETDPAFALSHFKAVLDQFVYQSDDQPISVMGSFSPKTEVDQLPINSSVGRELLYAFDHAVHHLAIVKIGLTNYFPHITLGANLGVAPTTQQFRSSHFKTITNQ